MNIEKKVIAKILKKYAILCEDCQKKEITYCGDCGGSRCEKCFIEHLGNCPFCEEER